MDRKKIIQNLINQRYTYEKIGRLLKISRQRVHQILTGYHSPLKIKLAPLKIKPIIKIPLGWQPSNNYKKPNWKKYEGREYLKEQVRKRDNYTCQICRKTWIIGKRRFDTHHYLELEFKRGSYENKKYENCKNLDGMITLCHKCHLNLPEHRGNNEKKYKNHWGLTGFDGLV